MEKSKFGGLCFKMAAYAHILGDPVKDRQVQQTWSLTSQQDKFLELLKAGHYQNIVVLTGAGVSVSSGIPDYRSKSGLFKIMQERYGMSSPEEIFSRKFELLLQLDPVYQEHLQKFQEAEPTAAHKWCAWLRTQGWLRRVYTQNIDGLHQKGGLLESMVVEFHGSLRNHNVTLYGDIIDPGVIAQVVEDFVINPVPVDLIIVMGTSLQVAPFCGIPNLVSTACPRVLIDICPSNAFRNPYTKRKPTYDCMYDCSAPAPKSSCVFKKGRVKREVSLRPQWSGKSRWKTQYILAMSADEWAGLFD